MRRLDRYLLKELCIPLFYCIAGFLIFWISFDLFSQLEDFQKAGLGAGDVIRFYAWRTPELLGPGMVLPIGLLLGLLYALTNHSRHNEIIAMRAAGISVARISVPYFAVSLLASILLFVLNEKVAPDGTEKAEAIKSGKSGAGGEQWVGNVHFRNARDHRIWNIGKFNLKSGQMFQAHVEWLLPGGGRKQIFAKSAGRTNDHWYFADAEIFNYAAEVDFSRPESLSVRTNYIVVKELGETPEQIRLQIKFHQMNAFEAAKRAKLSLEEIQYLQEHLELNKKDKAMLETQYHARIAQPWTCIVVCLIALPFAAGTNSRRNVFVGVAASIFICFAYFILLRFGLALGTGGYIPAWLAAWLPNMVFGGLGVLLVWRTK